MPDQAEQLRQLAKSQANNKTRVIAVSSGKGGVGKTNFAVNLAISYAQTGKKVLLLDADLGLANVNVVMGINPKYNLYHVIRKQKSMKDVIENTPYNVNLVAGASGFSRITNLSEDERREFILGFKDLSGAEIMIIDTSAGVSSNVLAFIEAADETIIITTPEPTSITDAYGIIKIISTEIDNRDFGLKLVVNRVANVTEAKKVSQRIVSISGQFLNIKVDYLGFVYEDSVIPDAVRKQKPFVSCSPDSRAAHCMKHIIGRMENIEYREGSGVPLFLKKLFKRMES